MAASAPGKLILFGEHAVVFGEPALATAINLRAEVYARTHPEWRADGGSIDEPRYRYVKAAIAKVKTSGPLWLEVRSMVPSGGGLGSSAAGAAATGPLVANVKERVEHDRKAADAVREIGRITLDGMEALRRNDLAAAGRLMDRNHALLTVLGVGHPMLDRLVQAARKTSYGAKLTGAGGGGSIVALSDRPAKTVEAIRAAGGKAFVVRSDPIGVATLS